MAAPVKVAQHCAALAAALATANSCAAQMTVTTTTNGNQQCSTAESGYMQVTLKELLQQAIAICMILCSEMMAKLQSIASTII